MDQTRENLSETLFLRATPSLRARLDEAAREERRDRSEYIRMALSDWLDLRARLGDGFDSMIDGLLGRVAA